MAVRIRSLHLAEKVAEKIRVSYFLGSLNIGGTQKNVVNILKNIDREKFEPRLCCLFSGGPLEEEINPLNIPTLICNYGPIYDIRIYFKIINFFRGSDILYCFGYPTIYFGVFLGWLAGTQNIIVAVQDRDVWKKWYHILLDRLIRPFVDLYIADGKGTIEFAIKQQGINPDKIIAIYDGADIDALIPKKSRSEIRTEFSITEDAQLVAVICRLDDKKKGVSYFLKAIPSILEKYSDTRFIIVGDGEDRYTLEYLSLKLKIRDKIIFTGFREDIPNILNAIDIFVIPSLWESVPKILVDAMAMGKAIVATTAGDIPELISDKKTGILIRPGEPREISDAVNLLIGDRTKVIALGNEAFNEIKRKRLILKESVENLESSYTQTYSKSKKISIFSKVLRYIYYIFLFPVVTISFFIMKFAESGIRKLGFK